MPRPPRALRYALGLCIVLAARPAAAASPLNLDILRQPLSTALLKLAEQTGLSISTTKAGSCAAHVGGVRGRYDPADALQRLLAGSGCTYHFIDQRAVEILPITPNSRPLAVLTPEPAAPTQVQELIVVATRRATAADRLAYPVSLVTRREIEDQGLGDDNALAAATPAMVVTNLGVGRDKILLRGLSDGPLTGRTQSMVGIYLDDVRLTYNAPDPDLKLVDVDQVEILRGPQGALYGSGSLGGVLHVVTAAPDPAAFAGTITVGGALTDHGAPSTTLEGVLNLPAPWAGGALRLVGYHEVMGGYIDDPGLGLHDVNRTQRDGARLTAQQALGPDWTVRARLVGQAINADDTQYAMVDVGPLARRNRLREPHDNDFAEASLSIEGALPWAQVHGSIAAVRHSLHSRSDATSAPPVAAPPGPVAFDDEDAIASLVGEATISAPASDRLQWLGGVFLAHTRQSTTLRLTPMAPTPDLFGEDRQDDLDEAALFGELRFPFGERLALTLGGRAFTSRTDVASRISAGPALTTLDGSVRTSGFAPKVVIAFQAAPSLLAYLQAAEGYRSGGINTTGLPSQAFSIGGGPEPDRTYQGDELWSFEAGVRASVLKGRLALRGAIYDATWRNIQSDELLPSGLPFTANIGSGTSLGFELESRYRDGPFEATAELMVDNPELNRANPAFPARPELSLAGVPSAMGGVTAHYSWGLPGGALVSLDGRVSYVGPSHLTFDERTSPRMGGYTTARLAVTWRHGPWRVTGAADNPANTRGDTFAFGNPFTVRAGQQATPLRPLTASLRLTRAFP